MKVNMDGVEISQAVQAIEAAKLVASIHEAQQRIEAPGLAAIIHIESMDDRAPIDIFISKDNLDGILRFMLHREVIALNRMGVDVKE